MDWTVTYKKQKDGTVMRTLTHPVNVKQLKIDMKSAYDLINWNNETIKAIWWQNEKMKKAYNDTRDLLIEIWEEVPEAITDCDQLPEFNIKIEEEFSMTSEDLENE